MKLLLLPLLFLFHASIHGQTILQSLPDNTLAVFHIQDLPALEAKRAASPLSKLPLLTAFESTLPELNQLKEGVQSILAQLAGELVLSVSNPEPYIALRAEHQQKKQALWNDVDWASDDSDAMDAILAAEEKMTQAEIEALRGMLIFQAQINDADALKILLTEWKQDLPDLRWDLQDDHLTLSFSESGINSAVANRNTLPGSTLTSTPDFLQANEFLGEQDALFFVNLPQIVNTLFPLLLSQADDSSPFDLANIVEWLQPEAILPLAFASRLTPESLRVQSHYGFRKETSLSRLLLTSTEKKAPTPDFVHRDSDQVLSFHWDAAGFLQTLQKDISILSPELGIAIGFFKMTANVNLGLDIETQLLQTLGTGITLVSETDHNIVNQLANLETINDPAAMLAFTREHPTGGIHYILGLEIKDRDTFQQSLETLITKLTHAPVPESVDSEGVEKTFLFANLTSMQPEIRAQIASTFLEDHWLIAIGDTTLLQRAYLAQTLETERLWTQQTFQQSREALPADASTLSYTSKRELTNTLKQIESGAKWLSILSGSNLTFTGEMPKEPLFENSIGTSVREGHRLKNETLLRFVTE